MESNFREEKMKLTKTNLVQEYATAINTIEDKDQEINRLLSDIASIRNELKKVRDEMKQLKPDNSEALQKENEVLKNNYQHLQALFDDVRNDYGRMLDVFEGHLKIMQTVNDNQINIWSVMKDNAKKKYGGK